MDSNNQQQMIRDAMKSIAERKPGRTKLVYDKTSRTIVAVAEGAQPARALNITAEDADMFAMLTLSSRWLREHWSELLRVSEINLELTSWDNGDAYVHSDLCIQGSGLPVSGMLSMGALGESNNDGGLQINLHPLAIDAPADQSSFVSADGTRYQASARITGHGGDETMPVCFADVQPELATRRTGLLETSVLLPKCVLCVGVGTGGSHVAIELAKSGVGTFILVDGDRLSTGNVVRHPGGLSNVGRYKVNVVRDLIREKNPDAKVEVYPVEFNFDNIEQMRALIQRADIVICGTDNRPSKLLVNQLCVELNKTALFGGAFRRAYGGQILRVRPQQSPCHECFIAAMPEEAADVEISSHTAADSVAYSDRPVAVEPGLSLDVLPIATMLAKLALTELLEGSESALKVLARDYDAPWYLWLNRPEPNTAYSDWPPLSESSDEMTINRWYGIYFERDPSCSVCGDLIGTLVATYNLDAETMSIPAERSET